MGFFPMYVYIYIHIHICTLIVIIIQEYVFNLRRRYPKELYRSVGNQARCLQ